MSVREWLRSKRMNVLGVRAHAIDTAGARRVVLEAVKRRTKGYVCFVPVNGVMEAVKDSRLMRVFEQALLVAPDGMPLVWVGRAQGFRSMERVAGPEFMLEVMEAPEFRQYTHFLCGGDYGVAEELAARLRARIPGLKIVGTFTPPFREMTDAEERSMIEAVHLAQPDFLWVGLGAPKQEHFMARYLSRLDTTVMFGVGAAFLIHTGRLQQSPLWVRKAGMQWLHRFLQEPRRMWRRYLIGNPAFLLRLACQMLRHGKAVDFGTQDVTTAYAEVAPEHG